MQKSVAGSLGLLVLVAFATPSMAAPIGTINGATVLQVTSLGALDSMGVTVTAGLLGSNAELVESAFLPSPHVFYQITSVDEDTWEIAHEGSNLDLTLGGTTVSLNNLLIDADDGVVIADVMSPSLVQDGVEVFNLRPCTVTELCIGLDGTTTIDGLELTVTATTAGVLTADLGLDDLTKVAIGVANSTYTLIPEPSTSALMALGLLGLAIRGRR